MDRLKEFNYGHVQNSYLFNSFNYALILLISGIDKNVTFLVNLVVITYGLSMYHNKKIKKLNFYFVLFSIGNLLIFHLMTDSYAETLPWEVTLHFLLYAIAYSYFYYYASNNKLDANSSGIKTIFDFKKTVYIERKVYVLVSKPTHQKMSQVSSSFSF